MKKIILMLLFLIPFVYALDECKGTITVDESPCLIFLPFNESNLDCSTHYVSIYNMSTLLYTQTLHNYSFFQCNATFNQTNTGTYIFQYDTGDSGSIIMEAGFKMDLLLYFGIAVALAFLLIGLWKQDQTFASISGILMIVMGVFIAINGFSTLNNLLSQALAIIFIAAGAYVFIRTNMENF